MVIVDIGCSVFFYLLFSLQCLALEDGAQYILEAGKRDCFYTEIEQGLKMEFDVQVLQGGDLDVGIQLSAPSGHVLVDEKRATEIDRELQAPENGTYEICFDNRFSLMTSKVVYFDLGVDRNRDQNTEEVYAGLQEKDKMGENEPEAPAVVKVLQGLHRKLEQVQLLQSAHRAKEARHRKTQENNFTRVTWFSLASCVIMIVVGILQVVIVRNLFSEKRGIRA